MIYEPWFKALYRRAATSTYKILNGANPSVMRAEQPTAFDLVGDQDAAKAIGTKIPESFIPGAAEMVRN